MSQAPTTAKLCIKCGQDCSKRPRTKDARGRYICQECMTRAQAARAAAVAAPPPPVDDEPIFALDDAALSAATAAAGKIERPRSCGNCGMVMGGGAVICTRCGLNTSTGKVLGTDKRAGAGKKCIKCGYALDGLSAPVCPECGTINTKEDRKRATDRKESDRIARNELIKPVVYFLISVAIIVGVMAAAGRNVQDTLTGLGISYAVSLPLGCIAYFICCMLWMGFDAPWRYTILRLAAAFAITDAASLVSSMMLIGFIAWGLPVIVMGYALHSLMDLDIQDGIIMAVVLMILKIAVVLALVGMAAQ